MMFSTALSAFVALAGAVVLVGGWLFDVDPLKRIRPEWVTMKPPTAIGFVLAGSSAMLFRLREHGYVGALITAFSALLVAWSSAFLWMGVHAPHVAALLTAGRDHETFSVAPGEPSIATLAGFFLLGMSGIMVVLRHSRWAAALASVPLAAGAVALAGYAASSPALFWYRPGVSTAMAIHTAALMVAASAAVLMGARWRGQPERSS